MSCMPSVIGSMAPVAIVTRFRFELPFSAETTMSDEPSVDQTIGLRPPPRGRRLIPADAAADVVVIVAVRFSPRALTGRVSTTNRSG